VAIGTGALLVVIAATSYPLFASASENELLRAGIADRLVTPYGAGFTYRSTHVVFKARTDDGSSVWRRRAEVFSRQTARSPLLQPAIEGVMGDEVAVTGPGGRVPASGPVNGRLFAGTDALAHVDVVAGSDGDGVWLPDLVAEPLHAAPGDLVELRVGQAVASARVDGIYRGLYSLPRKGYWQPWNDVLYPGPCLDCPIPPQPILVARDRFFDLETALGQRSATFAWQAPVRVEPPLTLDEARELRTFIGSLERRMSDVHDPFGRLFSCCGRFWGSPVGGQIDVRNSIPEVISQVEERAAAVQGPIKVIQLAGLAIAVGVIAAAGAFTFSSRRVEAGVLSIRGWGPTRVALKSALEAVLPCVVGGAVGWAVALTLIGTLGPDGAIDERARAVALGGSVVAVLVAVVVVGLVSAFSFTSRHEPRGWLRRMALVVPWEVAALGGALLLYRRLESEGGVIVTGRVARPGAAVFLFPVLLALGAGVLIARLVALLLAVGRGRRRERGRVTAGYLAVHRLTSSVRLAALFLVAGSLALAVFAAAQASVRSLRTSVEAKAEVFVGSDVQLQVGPDTTVPDGFPFPATIADRSRDAGTLGKGVQRFDLLALDPETVPGAAYWNGAFSDMPLEDLLDQLTGPGSGPLPVIVSNGGGVRPASVLIQTVTVPVKVVGFTSSFPGTSSERPVLVTSHAALARAFEGHPNPLHTADATHEMWIHGPAGDVLQAAGRAGITSYLTITAAEVEDIPFIVAAIDTFLVLNALGVVALVLVLVVAVVYLQARQRDRVVASALSHRMGLPASTMRRSLVLELGALLLASFVVGIAAGVTGATLVIRFIDPLPTIPPTPIAVWPLIAIVIGGLVLLLAAWIGGRLAHRGARGVRLGEVMRVAE
jgi:hypothetical protein